ncbi:hypothetical protein MTR67_030815 [Solanum verrucosum]|uniref:Uncharacterized protein n=1 Tax=Solanum verrucosum TaxID=315347 RepID=A0AAF0ZEZ7_SOLVR|nr:hypothetical protein MTR67_030815 [Solanum verrucosum]
MVNLAKIEAIRD